MKASGGKANPQAVNDLLKAQARHRLIFHSLRATALRTHLPRFADRRRRAPPREGGRPLRCGARGAETSLDISKRARLAKHAAEFRPRALAERRYEHASSVHRSPRRSRRGVHSAIETGSTPLSGVADLATRIFERLDRPVGDARHRCSESGHHRFARFDAPRGRSTADSAQLSKKIFCGPFRPDDDTIPMPARRSVRVEIAFFRISTRRRRAREVRIPWAFLASMKNPPRNFATRPIVRGA